VGKLIGEAVDAGDAGPALHADAEMTGWAACQQDYSFSCFKSHHVSQPTNE
jgi:hypothetical protein